MIISTIFRNRTTQKILRVVVPLAFWLGAWQLAAIWVDTVYTPGHGALLLPSPLLVWERLAALAARPGSDLTEVEQVYAGMEKCMEEHRYGDYKHYNESFHMALWEAADNPKLARILASLWNGLSLGFLMTETDYAKISFFEHRQLMEALRAHDPEKARKLMDEHMERSMENILTNYREQVGKKL